MSPTDSTSRPPTVTQTRHGEPHTYPKARGGGSTTTRIGQRFEVARDGVILGYVERRLVTRERRLPGRRYVESRWESPAWVAVASGAVRGFEVRSKQAGIDRLAQ